MAKISDNKLLFNDYRFSAANTARVSVAGSNRGQLTNDGRMGFDCSGFVDYVLRSGGYQIGSYMSTAQVFTSGNTLTTDSKLWQSTVQPAQARPGDLVYFSGHVGIVV